MNTRILMLTVISWFVAGVANQVVGAEPDYIPPREVQVLPVFFVPKDEALPTEVQKARLQRHLSWARDRYFQMLHERDTFAIAPRPPLLVRGRYAGADYDAMPEDAGPQFISEVLSAMRLTRFNAPYVFFIVVMNTRNERPGGGGRPLNGGFNTGPGMVEVSSWGLDKSTNFQSTVQHELGHAFGLPHTDALKYLMNQGASIMSYNLAHHTDGFNPSRTPGILIPEDIRGLAWNRRVFPRLFFDVAQDVPRGYRLADRAYLGPQKIPGQPDYVIKGTTKSGDEFGGSLSEMLNNEIQPNWGWTPSGYLSAGPSTFNHSMWHSAQQAPYGWVEIELTLPVAAGLTRIATYTQHTSAYHMAEAVRIQVQTKGQFLDVVSEPLKSPDSFVDFPETTGRVWRLHFQAGKSGMVVVRGLRFFHGPDEIFVRPIPTFD
jgi:hypothetical protein